jgi:uncharacterized membrane protein
MAFIMVSVAYGITYIFNIDPYPVPLHYVFFIFAIGFVIFSVFFEKERGAIYPWSLMGGAIASAIFTFIVNAAIGGIRYIMKEGFTVLGTDTWLYSLSISIILSMILLNLAKHKL